MGIFLDTGLHEHRLQEDIMKHDWTNHPLIQPQLTDHIFSIYLPWSEQKSSSGGNAELKHKQNKTSTIMSNQAKSIDKVSGRNSMWRREAIDSAKISRTYSSKLDVEERGAMKIPDGDGGLCFMVTLTE